MLFVPTLSWSRARRRHRWRFVWLGSGSVAVLFPPQPNFHFQAQSTHNLTALYGALGENNGPILQGPEAKDDDKVSSWQTVVAIVGEYSSSHPEKVVGVERLEKVITDLRTANWWEVYMAAKDVCFSGPSSETQKNVDPKNLVDALIAYLGHDSTFTQQYCLILAGFTRMLVKSLCQVRKLAVSDDIRETVVQALEQSFKQFLTMKVTPIISDLRSEANRQQESDLKAATESFEPERQTVTPAGRAFLTSASAAPLPQKSSMYPPALATVNSHSTKPATDTGATKKGVIRPETNLTPKQAPKSELIRSRTEQTRKPIAPNKRLAKSTNTAYVSPYQQSKSPAAKVAQQEIPPPGGKVQVSPASPPTALTRATKQKVGSGYVSPYAQRSTAIAAQGKATTKKVASDYVSPYKPSNPPATLRKCTAKERRVPKMQSPPTLREPKPWMQPGYVSPYSQRSFASSVGLVRKAQTNYVAPTGQGTRVTTRCTATTNTQTRRTMGGPSTRCLEKAASVQAPLTRRLGTKAVQCAASNFPENQVLPRTTASGASQPKTGPNPLQPGTYLRGNTTQAPSSLIPTKFTKATVSRIPVPG